MKSSVIFAILILHVSVNAQNIVQISGQANENYSKEDCAFRINGICSTEDIGGVSLDFRECDLDGRIERAGCAHIYLHAENFNNCSVTVLVQYDTKYSIDHITSFVLRPGEKIARFLEHSPASSGKLDGMIVRKLAQ